ncbi:hypothetical protein [Paenibacillus sp. L3-i20]|uniref:hypothetical protein n=1 Tax=Paenibacillus sp. L3-i20 TaxID=2905833 RepID=UPI001EDD4A6D|nr:hypothetical protein [Paenibacillus sp. L3-i20]GKU79539.1 hypothetical protein L3i20_v239360 [Paenibacillus sp. L3-i20]
MDKRKVIDAYRHGFITIQECAQIIGVDKGQMNRLVNDWQLTSEAVIHNNERSMNTL